MIEWSPLRVLLVDRLLAAGRPLDLREILRGTPAMPSDVLACLLPVTEAGLLVAFGTDAERTWRVPGDGHSKAELEREIAPFRSARSTLRQLADHAVSDLVGDGPKMRVVLEQIRLAARTNVPVLITGETGTGKELVARAIHGLGPRSGHAFIALNAAAIPTGLFEAELFGHERGAFTGAVRRRAGALERADGGTLFLDEIADLEAAAQAKLLRVLQESSYRPVGSDRERRIDLRPVCATNRSLEARVRSGEFREDFFYRINVIGIHVPSLRERAEDIPELALRFVERNAQRWGVRQPNEVTKGAMERLAAHSWPGNVRELEAVIARGALLAAGGPLTTEGVDVALAAHWRISGEGRPAAQASESLSLRDLHRERVTTALAKHRGNVTAAARGLGISKVTLYRHVAELERQGPGFLERMRAGGPVLPT